MMPMTEQLILITDAFCAATGSSRGSVAGRVFNDGKRLDAIAAGADLKTRSFEHAIGWFDANWPMGAAWPLNVERPSLKRVGDAIRNDLAAEIAPHPDPLPSGERGEVVA